MKACIILSLILGAGLMVSCTTATKAKVPATAAVSTAASAASPESIVGKRLHLTTNTDRNGMDFIYTGGLTSVDMVHYYIDYEKTGPDTAELNIQEDCTARFTEHYYLHFTDSKNAIITKAWSGCRSGQIGVNDYTKAPINISGSISLH